jgi:DNA processing protein
MNGFEGSVELLQRGARPLPSKVLLFRSLGLNIPPPGHIQDGASPPSPSSGPNPEPETTEETVISQVESPIYMVISSTPLHLDEVAHLAGVAVQVAAAALLTLVLENVVVEGPPGFFRRRDTSNR